MTSTPVVVSLGSPSRDPRFSIHYFDPDPPRRVYPTPKDYSGENRKTRRSLKPRRRNPRAV
jgi:hypothetical protein